MEPDPPGPFEELMLRGEKLRALRLMALADEQERKIQNELEMVLSPPTCTQYVLDDDTEKSTSLQIPYESSSSIVNIDFLQCDSRVCDYELPKDLSETTVSTSGASSRCPLLLEDKIDVLPDSKLKVLRYESYLAHQRYHDDYKHSNCDFIDFKIEHSEQNQRQQQQRIVVEQQRRLGKGGLLWDAGVILAEHMVAHDGDWKLKKGERNITTRIVDLGAGIGFTGIMIAKSVADTHVTITDLPELLPLMKRNVERNFVDSDIIPVGQDEDLCSSSVGANKYQNRGEAAQDIPCHVDKGCKGLSVQDTCVLYEEGHSATSSSGEIDLETIKASRGKITAAVLRWGVKEDYANAPYDVIVAADVVASLYSPKALAETIHDLCHDETKVYISLKKRLTEPLVVFEAAMKDLFLTVKYTSPISRRKLDDIIVIEATGKR